MIKIAILLLLISFNAFAETALLSGEPPTLREDGVAFDVATELKGFNVYCGLMKGVYDTDFSFVGYTLPRTEWIVDVPNGISYCVITAIDTDGRESMYSDEITVTMDGKYPPMSPNVIETIINIIITLPQTTSSTPSLTIN